MNKKKYMVILSVIGVLALTTITALTITALTAERINLFGGTVQDTDFIITDSNIKLKGQNKITLTLDVLNNDVTGHTANITAQLLDSSGDLIMEYTAVSGVVAGSGTYIFNHDFVTPGLVGVFISYQVVVKQLS